MHTINLVVGDWSHDGHGMTDSIAIICSHTAEQVKTAYRNAVNKLGFPDLVKEACSEYEESSLSSDFALKLIAAIKKQPQVFPQKMLSKMIKHIANGVNEDQAFDILEEVASFGITDTDDLDGFIDSETFAHLYMMIAAFGDPTINWENNSHSDIMIGGYGLFCS